MAKKSTRIKAPVITTRTAFQTSVDELARIEVELRAAEAARDEELQAVRDEHAETIDSLAARRDRLILATEKYAADHRDELFPGKIKSAETSLAVFGFRLGQPTLKLLNRKWTWQAVMDALQHHSLSHLIRTKCEPDKDGIKQLPPEQIAALGCRIDQAEAFYVEPKEQPSATAA